MTTITIKVSEGEPSVYVKAHNGKWLVEANAELTIPFDHRFLEPITIEGSSMKVIRAPDVPKPKPIDVGWHLPERAE